MGKKILVVDDEPVIVKILESRLKAEGYQVSTAHSGEVGLEKCKLWKPGAIILDVMMPDMDGPTVAATIKENPNLSKTPIIFLTAAVKPQEVPKDGKIGGHYFLSKAFEMNELLRILKKILPEE